MVLFRCSRLTHLSLLIHHGGRAVFQVAARQHRKGPLIDKRVSQASSAPSPSTLGRLWWLGGGASVGRSPCLQTGRLVPEWEVTTAGEPVAASPKCSIFRDAGMQIKCQLAGEDMKHWQYQLLKSLHLEQRECVYGNGRWGHTLSCRGNIFHIWSISPV